MPATTTSPTTTSRTLHDGPLAVLAGDGEGVHEPRRDAVAAVGQHAHGHPLALDGAVHPVPHVVAH
eukprot:7261962-Pyramimonas_sp.AAC.1